MVVLNLQSSLDANTLPRVTHHGSAALLTLGCYVAPLQGLRTKPHKKTDGSYTRQQRRVVKKITDVKNNFKKCFLLPSKPSFPFGRACGTTTPIMPGPKRRDKKARKKKRMLPKFTIFAL